MTFPLNLFIIVLHSLKWLPVKCKCEHEQDIMLSKTIKIFIHSFHLSHAC